MGEKKRTQGSNGKPEGNGDLGRTRYGQKEYFKMGIIHSAGRGLGRRFV
jgi:hypothetical protein